jgi:hypothetical protein
LSPEAVLGSRTPRAEEANAREDYHIEFWRDAERVVDYENDEYVTPEKARQDIEDLIREMTTDAWAEDWTAWRFVGATSEGNSVLQVASRTLDGGWAATTKRRPTSKYPRESPMLRAAQSSVTRTTKERNRSSASTSLRLGCGLTRSSVRRCEA